MTDEILYLYGGDQPWDSSLWVTTDDRVRGGSSISHLTVLSPERARFHGHLDTSTLGGAGFASQHSLGELSLDLSDYDAGIVITVVGVGEGPSGNKRYALTLKDELPGRRDDGREKSGVSWEAEFDVDGPREVVLRWDDFVPTYRGREKEDAEPLKKGEIKQVGLMMRSFFGQQDGDFSVDIHSIAAHKGQPEESMKKGSVITKITEKTEAEYDEESLESWEEKQEERTDESWWRSWFGCLHGA